MKKEVDVEVSSERQAVIDRKAGLKLLNKEDVVVVDLDAKEGPKTIVNTVHTSNKFRHIPSYFNTETVVKKEKRTQ